LWGFSPRYWAMSRICCIY